MKKLLILLMVGILATGCNSTKDGKSAKTDNTNKITQKENDEEKNEESKDEEGNNKDDSKQDNDDVASNESQKNDSDNTATDTKKDSGSGSSSQPSGSSQSGGSSTKDEQTSEPSKPVTPPVQETTPPAPEPTPEAPSIQIDKANQVFAQINEYRRQNGKEPFTLSTTLKARSEAHALAMAQSQALWHSGNAVENVTNYDDPFTAWKNSASHNEILLCNNTTAAVGIYYYNGYYYSVFQCQW